MKKPVFIIGLHRTGSTLLKNIIESSDEINMAKDEMHISTPWRKDVIYYYKKNNVHNMESLKEFIKCLYEGKPHGSFWRYLKDLDIDMNELIKSLGDNYSLDNIMKNILEQLSSTKGKERYGVKYPVHFSRIDLLLKWFPDCRIVHITRDPRAICASKVHDEATEMRKDKYKIISPYIHWGTIMFFVFEYTWSTQIHEKYKDIENYKLVNYEDIVGRPEKTIKSLSSFCEIKFKKEMLVTDGKKSSFFDGKKNKFDTRRINKWKKELTTIEKAIIGVLTKRSRERLND